MDAAASVAIAPASPMLRLIRECIETPCRKVAPSSRLFSHESLDTSVLAVQSVIKQKVVSFAVAAEKPARAKSMSPSKLPSITDGILLKAPIAHFAVIDQSTEEGDMAATISPLDQPQLLDLNAREWQEEIEERDAEIRRLRELLSFLSNEVKIYTTTLEVQLQDQSDEINCLRLELAKLQHLHVKSTPG